MRKFNELKDDEAIEILGDIIEPAYTIMTDDEVKAAFRTNEKTLIKLAKIICKKYTKEVFEILAVMDGQKVEEYHCSFFTLPFRVLEILNNKDLLDFFSSAAGVEVDQPSTSAMESTLGVVDND